MSRFKSNRPLINLFSYREHKNSFDKLYSPRPTTMSSFFSWSPFAKSTSNESETIEIRHGKQTYNFTFTPEALSTLTVAELKSLARQQAQLADDVEVKLLFQGRRMDDREEVVKYNVRNGSRILMTSGRKVVVPKEATTPDTNTSTSTPVPKTTANGTTKAVDPMTPLEKIYALRQSIKDAYGAQIHSFVNNPPKTRKERSDTKARLSELLLQQLLKFDDVIIDPDEFGSKEARLERKAAVKWVQGLMADIDKVDVNAVQ